MKGIIACGDPQTAAAGAAMLEIGGNAVDAAVAATFASFVAEAALVNIGGSGIAMIVGGDGSEATVYDFFSTMPSGRMGESADFRSNYIMLDLVARGGVEPPTRGFSVREQFL